MRQKKQLRRYRKNLSRFLAEGVLSAILISCIIAVIMVTIITMIVIPSMEDLTPPCCIRISIACLLLDCLPDRCDSLCES